MNGHAASPSGPHRRDFLYIATGATGAVVAGAAVWPLIDSMNPSADVAALATVEVDLDGVEPGSRITVSGAARRSSSITGRRRESRQRGRTTRRI